jgi:hypothetical protein
MLYLALTSALAVAAPQEAATDVAASPAAPVLETATPPRPPPTQIAIAVVQALGSTTSRLALVSDPLNTKDEDAVRLALTRTGLFELVAPELASAIIVLSRDRDAVTVTLRGEPPRELVRVAWSPEAPVAPQAGGGSEELYERVRTYERERLHIEPIVRAGMYPNMAMSTHSPWAWQGGLWNVGWGFNYAGPSSPMNDWVVVRGAAEVLDEVELAELTGNQRLAREIEETRFWPRLYWGLGFGLGAAAGIGSGLYLYDQDDRDRRAVGASLVLLGVASAALAILSPVVGSGHVLSANEAEHIVDDHNTTLRRQLGLSPEDVQRFKE